MGTVGRGVADGGVGGVLTPALFVTGGGSTPRKFRIFRFFFSNVYEKLHNIYVCKIKWPKTEEKLNFGGR